MTTISNIAKLITRFKHFKATTTKMEGLLLGVGNPLLDISAKVNLEFLSKYDMKKNDAILAEDKHKPIYKELMDKYQVEFTAGGSVQNTLRVSQWILEKPKVTTFFGAVGEDEYAKILQERAIAEGVNVQYQHAQDSSTGTCAVLITGTDRSLCANLAAANLFTPDHLAKSENKKLIESAQYFYISGFFLTVSPPSIQEIAKHALAHNKTFIMNLSAPFLSTFYKKPLMEAMPYVDILFGNESEAETFASEQNFQTKDLKEIAQKICDLPKQNENKKRIVIITTGTNPVILADNGKITEYPIIKLEHEKVVDTNGAGDAFVGGFLAQYIQQQPLEVCIKCGVWTASQIIQRSGCTFEGKATFKP
ncbi:PREDICTED: adenosine kinase 2 isoform X2 [Nicrophorus vespilloides]|uniref:Adenosine kinase n=1 Tax=Nicrophorus vespilloides TaxID=110193 RepID=A0ABM1MW23_NICVS|nr:PREDICTED: adenosine kinase 2 isoform X2 [Nicrophorus vespilloides]